MRFRRWVVRYALAITLAIGAKSAATLIPIEGLDPREIGITAEEFVDLDLAKKVALYNYIISNPNANPDNIRFMVFPWAIKEINQYEPPVNNYFYEIVVYEDGRSINY